MMKKLKTYSYKTETLFLKALKTKIIKPHAGFQESFVRTNVDVCFAGGVLNAGKAQPLYSKILTPYGFTTMGEITVGSIICDTEGKTQRVEAVYERGIRDCYRITFSNGASVDCCDEHLWDVYDTLKCDVVTIELSQIIKNPKRYRLYLPKEIANTSIPFRCYNWKWRLCRR